MSEADAIEYVGYLFVAYASGWGVGFLQHAAKRFLEMF